MKTVTRETKPQHPQDDPDHMLLLLVWYNLYVNSATYLRHGLMEKMTVDVRTQKLLKIPFHLI